MIQIKKMVITLCVFTLVQSEPPVRGYNYEPNNYNLNSYDVPSNTYLPPKTGLALPSSYLPPNSFTSNNVDYSHDHGHHGHHNHENEIPKSYEFGYSVKDAKSGNDYDRREVSDGNVVRGEYRVQLPDGRTQIVSYYADWQTGFHADVRYEGEARYPETQNHNNQGYNYNTPEYSGSLDGFHNGGSTFKPAYGPPGYH